MHALKALSDRELVSRLKSLVEKEKSLTLEIVSHLVEVAHRGLHLAKGYGSLYEYCRGELCYTDASAWRRARAAQAILRCPEAWERLVQGRVTLCALGRVHAFIAPPVLEEICGKSKAEVEWIAARYDAKGISPDRMRPVMVPKPVGSVQSGAGDEGLRGEVTSSSQEKLPPLPSEVRLRGQSNLRRLRGEVNVSSEGTPPPLRSEVTSSGQDDPGKRKSLDTRRGPVRLCRARRQTV